MDNNKGIGIGVLLVAALLVGTTIAAVAVSGVVTLQDPVMGAPAYITTSYGSSEGIKDVLVKPEINQRADVLDRLTKGAPPEQLEVPENIKNQILNRANNYDGIEWHLTKLLYINKVDDLYDALVLLERGNETRYLEVVVEGNKIESAEIIPILLDQTVQKEVIEEFDVSDKNQNVPAKRLKVVGNEIYEIQLQTTSTQVIYSWTTIQEENIFGTVLWRLTAAGYFHIDAGVEVFYVADDSTVYANELLGWSVDWFDTDVRWTYLIGEVRADASFDGPFGINRNAWAWVAVDRNGNDYHDSGTY